MKTLTSKKGYSTFLTSVQVTTFSELMGETDIQNLYKNLNPKGNEKACELRCLYLKDLTKEKHFTESLR